MWLRLSHPKKNARNEKKKQFTIMIRALFHFACTFFETKASKKKNRSKGNKKKRQMTDCSPQYACHTLVWLRCFRRMLAKYSHIQSIIDLSFLKFSIFRWPTTTTAFTTRLSYSSDSKSVDPLMKGPFISTFCLFSFFALLCRMASITFFFFSSIDRIAWMNSYCALSNEPQMKSPQNANLTNK